jgi:proline iminopeptidase
MNSILKTLNQAIFFLIISVVAQAQTLRLKTSEGYIKTQDSVRLYYNIVGTGNDTIMVVHGGPYNSNYLLSDIKPLAAHHTLLFYDQRSAGYSTVVKDTARLNVSKYIEDIETVRKHFNIDKVNLLGYSKGGLLAGNYAATYPNRVKSMILVNPSPLTNWKSAYASKMDSVTNLIYEQNEKKYKNSPVDSTKSCWDYYALEARYFYPSPVHARRMWGDVCNSIQANMLNPNLGYMGYTIKKRNIIPKLAQIKAPVLVLAGDQDYKPFGAFEEWKESFPNSAIVRFRGSGHFPHVDNPDLFFAAVEQFLTGKFPDNNIYKSKGAGIILKNDDDGTPYQQARAAVIRIEDKLVNALNNSDWSVAASLYSNDAVIYAPSSPPVVGASGYCFFLAYSIHKGYVLHRTPVNGFRNF